MPLELRRFPAADVRVVVVKFGFASNVVRRDTRNWVENTLNSFWERKKNKLRGKKYRPPNSLSDLDHNAFPRELEVGGTVPVVRAVPVVFIDSNREKNTKKRQQPVPNRVGCGGARGKQERTEVRLSHPLHSSVQTAPR